MRGMLKLALLVVCTMLAVVFAACGDDDEDSGDSSAAAPTSAAATTAAAEPTAAESSAAAEPTAEETAAESSAAEEPTAEETAAESTEAAGGTPVVLPGDCGKLPFADPKEDPNGILPTLALPENLNAAYNNYGPPLFDTYKDFQPKNPPPWKVGYSDSFSGNAWRAAALASLQQNFAAAKEQGIVEGDLVVTDSNGDNDVQIQQMRQMIQQGVDIIFSIPASPTAMNGVIEEAYKAGIPVLTLSAPVTSEFAINVDTNQLVYGARQAQGLVMLLEGKGNILAVEGIAGTPGSQGIEEGGKLILESCPDIKIVADYSGDWNNATAKTATLQALATNPGQIDGVWEQGSMEKGIIEAFEQAGRDVPPVTMGNPDQAGLAYWRDHQADGYHTAATAQPSAAGADAMFRVGMRVMEGKGLKITSVVGNPPLTVDSDTLAAAQATFPDADVQSLDDWVKAEWTFDSPGVANPASGPTGTWLNDEMLDSFFTTPGTEYAGIENAGQDA